MSTELWQELATQVIHGDRKGVENSVHDLLAQGVSSREILEAMITAMGEVGRRFEACEYFLPDMILSSEAMKAGLKHILPRLKEEGQAFRGKVILGSVQGDVHDVGKSIVGSALIGSGYEVVDLGVDVAPEVFAQRVRELGAEVVGASAYMTTTTVQLPKVNEALKAAGVRDKVKFIIGGAATSDAYVDWAGADGWAETAWDAVTLVNRLLSKSA